MMPHQAKLEDAVTRQMLDSDSDSLPPLRKVEKLLPIRKSVFGRPKEVRLDAGPYWDGKGFQPGSGPETGIPYVLDREKLKCEISEGAGADIHLETVTGWELTLMIESLDACAGSVVLVSANPDMDSCG